MPIKIFAAPGDHRNDFDQIEKQVNEWEATCSPTIQSVHPAVNAMPSSRDLGAFMMTLVVHYEA